LKKLGMIVVEPDVPAFRAAMKDIPSKWEDKWGKGLYEKLANIK
jgi:TRAP-type C4-dicarboxylate transport system substrate-binding protein